ncbi:hypothetical protein ACJX0J_010379, partial [Zea mays]
MLLLIAFAFALAEHVKERLSDKACFLQQERTWSPGDRLFTGKDMVSLFQFWANVNVDMHCWKPNLHLNMYCRSKNNLLVQGHIMHCNLIGY